MRMQWTIAAAAAVVAFAAPAVAGPDGTYMVTGTNPGGGGSYSGTVSVKQVGDDVWSVRWKVGNDTFVGTGVGNDDFISVGYKSGNTFGVALYVREGRLWQGVWAYGGATEVGQETWTPQ